MRLAEKYRPRSLSEIVGQPAVRQLRAFCLEPYARCWLLKGEPGTGKSSAALALAAELGADNPMDLEVVSTGRWAIEAAERTMQDLWLMPFYGKHRVLILEELEKLSQPCQIMLKVRLEGLPRHAVVVATSNDLSGLQPALVERFGRPLEFNGWTPLAEGAQGRLIDAWKQESGGAELPADWLDWGWHKESFKRVRFSLRAAWDDMQAALAESAVSV